MTATQLHVPRWQRAILHNVPVAVVSVVADLITLATLGFYVPPWPVKVIRWSLRRRLERAENNGGTPP